MRLALRAFASLSALAKIISTQALVVVEVSASGLRFAFGPREIIFSRLSPFRAFVGSMCRPLARSGLWLLCRLLPLNDRTCVALLLVVGVPPTLQSGARRRLPDAKKNPQGYTSAITRGLACCFARRAPPFGRSARAVFSVAPSLAVAPDCPPFLRLVGAGRRPSVVRAALPRCARPASRPSIALVAARCGAAALRQLAAPRRTPAPYLRRKLWGFAVAPHRFAVPLRLAALRAALLGRPSLLRRWLCRCVALGLMARALLWPLR